MELLRNAPPPAGPNALQRLERPVVDLGVLDREYEQVATPQLNQHSRGPHLRNRLLRLAAKFRADFVTPLLPIHESKLYPRPSSSCRRLLPQPGGFEGFGSLLEHPKTSD
jgi:hypothetical protein